MLECVPDVLQVTCLQDISIVSDDYVDKLDCLSTGMLYGKTQTGLTPCNPPALCRYWNIEEYVKPA